MLNIYYICDTAVCARNTMTGKNKHGNCFHGTYHERETNESDKIQ